MLLFADTKRVAASAALTLCLLLSLSGCVRLVPQTGEPQSSPPPVTQRAPVAEPAPAPTPVAPPAPIYQRAADAPLAYGPSPASLIVDQSDAVGSLASFIESCPKLVTRDDASGLTRRADWQTACTAARTWPQMSAIGFFATHFETVRIADGDAFATGYFEPEIRGSRTRRPGYETPVYAMPADLQRAWPADTPEAERTGRPPLGRYTDDGEFRLYFERSQIVSGALDGRVPVIAWVADPIEFFFLQIQGSGRLATPDGDVMRIGYAGQNGREYVAIGRIMREGGMIGDGTDYPTSMQGIVAYLRDHPDEAQGIMNANKSWIFFSELTGDGPLGALGVPVRRDHSVAADPAFVPLGAPVWLDMEQDIADGLWIAQDTGGAIKGANRFDTFWGAGEDAARIAGAMSASGNALILLPKGTLARLQSR